MSISSRLNSVLGKAEAEAKQMGDEYVSVEHLLLAIVESDGPAGEILKEFGLHRSRLTMALQEVRGNQRVTSQDPEATINRWKNTALT